MKYIKSVDKKQVIVEIEDSEESSGQRYVSQK